MTSKMKKNKDNINKRERGGGGGRVIKMHISALTNHHPQPD